MATSGEPVRDLALVGTTRRARQWEGERAIVTAMTTEHPMWKLAGRTLVTLRPLTVYVADPVWAELLGPAMLVPGGTALEIDEGFLAAEANAAEKQEGKLLGPTDPQHLPIVPCRVVDPDLPPVRVGVDPMDVDRYCNVAPAGSGARVGKPHTTCGHPAKSIDDLVGRACPGCFLRWWKARADAGVVLDTEAVHP